MVPQGRRIAEQAIPIANKRSLFYFRGSKRASPSREKGNKTHGLACAITPVFNEKALILGDALVISDLHIGIEHELRDKGIFVRSSTDVMRRKIVRLLKHSGAAKLIILGDLKHSIPLGRSQASRSCLRISLGSAEAVRSCSRIASRNAHYEERSEVKNFVEKLSDHADIVLIKGNHDGNLERMFPDRKIYRSYLIGSTLLTHGHADIGGTPECSRIIIGHNHPCVEFVDDFGKSMRESAWIKARLNKKAVKFYKMRKAPELIVVPAFNDLISGTPFNTKRHTELLGPLFRRGFVNTENARAYLLDGTLLGKIKELYASDKKR